MEEIYWSGYAIAFILEIISIIIAFSQKYSIRAKNLYKVGLHYSFNQGNFIEGNKPGFFSNFFGIIFRILINPFLSWIMVFVRGYGFISLINQKISNPEKIKEIQYKLGASLLSEEEVKKLIKESANFMGKDIIFEDEEDDNTLILENDEDGWYAEISLDKKNRKAYLYSHSPDYDSVFTTTYEYKIEGNILYRKVLEKEIEHRGEKEYEVKDGVILETYIKEKSEEKLSFFKYEDKIKELNEQINRNKNYNYKIKYYILSKHHDILKETEFRKILRHDLERIKGGFIQVSDLCKSNNIELVYNEEDKYYQYKYLEETKNNNIKYKNFSKNLESLLLKINCKRYEIEQYNEIIETINLYLGKQKNDN